MPPRLGTSSAFAGSASRSAAAAPATSPPHNPIAYPVTVSYSLDGGSPPVELSKGDVILCKPSRYRLDEGEGRDDGSCRRNPMRPTTLEAVPMIGSPSAA